MNLERKRLIQNAVYIPEDDKYLKSGHVHDFVEYTTKSGHYIMLDGGCEYLRRGFDKKDTFDRVTIDYTLYDNDSFDKIAYLFLWGTYGKDGKGPFKWKPLRDCELDHLIAIRDTQTHVVGTIVEKVVKYWIQQKSK